MPMDDIFEKAKILFTALADKSRLKILHALKARQELCVCDIAEVLGVQVSVASHHLRKLRDLKVLGCSTEVFRPINALVMFS